VRRLAAKVRAGLAGARLSTLVNNAGVYEQQPRASVDGLEMTWAVNVAAPFLLTSLLLDAVTDRIVTVASISAASSMDFTNLQQERGYSAHGAYSLSKLANICFSHALAKRLQKAGSAITSNSLDPGTVNTKMLLAGWGPIGMRVADAGDAFFVATDSSLAEVSGAYFVGARRRTPPAQRRIWRCRRGCGRCCKSRRGLNGPCEEEFDVKKTCKDDDGTAWSSAEAISPALDLSREAS
jgi:NAD(P)-dependent dehydrogenase (short-subunit alcohol dehydrogenase family)